MCVCVCVCVGGGGGGGGVGIYSTAKQKLPTMLVQSLVGVSRRDRASVFCRPIYHNVFFFNGMDIFFDTTSLSRR